MSASRATGLAITDPLVKYRTLLSSKAITRDPAQYRLALHLQKLYERLKDYEPQIEYSRRLDQISQAVGRGRRQDAANADAVEPPTRRSSWRSLLAAKESRDSLALTRKLTSAENAMHIDSPKGLMLHGEVGTGKSMLIDLFADCLPNRKKRRWHFSTFMLETFAKLEALRRNRDVTASAGDDDYSMLWLARDMIEKSPIVFLDEFQLPDRAASKIMTNLMTSFFHLGGVLIATSNRMPEELAKAAGIEFPPPPSKLESLGWQLGLRRRNVGASDRLFAGQNEFAGFLDVLKARCEVWEMEGLRDYRRLESGKKVPTRRDEEVEWQVDGHEDLQHGAGMAGWPEAEAEDGKEAEASVLATPVNYVVDSSEDNRSRASVLSNATGHQTLKSIPWEPSVIKVYGRLIPVPRAWQGTTCWSFEELCKTTLGPADYITLASTYHTLILTDVPVLTWLMKNEARRFITLLDALYECRCKLLITAAAGPDDIFFPGKPSSKDGESDDAVYPETFSEVYQDATAPFRPNILSQNPNYAEPDPEPDYTHARLAGLLNADALEDDPPNKPHRKPFDRSFGRTDSEMDRRPIDPDEPRRYTSPNFAKTGAFTGEDERFAYKRAQSRLWEMCGAKWWARDEPDWHRPLPQDVRTWELTSAERAAARPAQVSSEACGDAAMGDAVEDSSRDERSFRHSPFRTATEPPPKFSWTHVWGTTKWGKKAGAWGQGVEGLKDRGDQKR